MLQPIFSKKQRAKVYNWSYRNDRIPEETIQEFFDRKPDAREFHTLLNKIFNERGIDNPTVYKKAGIDRKTWPKHYF